MLVRASSEQGIGKCITVLLDNGYEDVQGERLMEAIGSANPGPGQPPSVRCALSVTNFEKIKRLFPAAKLDIKHDITVEMVRKLKDAKALYDHESHLGNLVKEGKELPREYPFPDYDFKMKPFAHQIVGWQFLHVMTSSACFGEPGIGKTFIVSTWADSLVRAGHDIVLLVLCPVTIIKHAWLADIAKFTDLTATRLHEPSSYKRKEKREARFAEDSNVYIINPELFIRVEKEVKALLKRHMRAGKKIILVVDESSKIKNHTSAIYKALKRLRPLTSRAVIMTGTPASNGIGDLWSQFDILDMGMTLQPKWRDYRHDTHVNFTMRGVDYYVKKGDGIKKIPVIHWRPRARIAPTVYKWVRPHMIRFRAEDCLDLPDKQFLRRDITMTKEQEKAYAEMRDLLYTEFEGEGITARVAAVRMMKLREITGGFIITDKGKQSPLNKETPKMIELDLILDQVLGERLGDENRQPTKAIIWAQYRWECTTLNRRYRRYGSRGLYGGISHTKRDDNIEAFQNDPKCQVLVCHPKSAGHGLTLTAANYAIYYSLSYDYDEFYQSARRIARPGQTRPMFFYFLMAPGTIDEVIARSLEEKKKVSDIITDGPFNRAIFDSLALPDGQQLNIDLEVE